MSKAIEVNLNDLPAERRKKILARADELIQEELTLREVRCLREKTQKELAILLEKRQDEISRLERREDFLVSTLADYIEALGGHLKIVAEFNDSPPITIRPSKLRVSDRRQL